MKGSPTKQERALLKERRKKTMAFQSFLQQKTQQTPTLDVQTANHSDQEQNEDQNGNDCVVCRKQIGDRKKYCGFCRGLACNDHMRKKRKNKNNNNKFVRVCDNCEDKYLYEKYMKLELKNQQSITAQETIIGAKRDEVEEQLNGRKTKLQILYNKQNDILLDGKEQKARFDQIQNEINHKMQKLERKKLALQADLKKLKQFEQSLPPSLEDDYNSLEIENQKVIKQLVKNDKLCSEAIKIKSKKQKQIYEEYYEWQRTKKQQITKKDQDCSIF